MWGRVICALAIVVATVGPAISDPASDAAAHMERGLRRYNTQDYDGAIAEWREAYVLAPSPDTLFAIGQAQRLKGDCKAALVTYRTILRDPVSAEQTAEINRVIGVCEKQVASEPPTPVTSKPDTTTPTPETPTQETPGAARRPWYKDPLGMTLLVAGTASVAVGGTFVMLGRSAEADADAATNYEAYASAADLAKRDRLIGYLGVATGGALLIGCAIRLATRSDTVEVGASVADRGASLTIAGRF